MSENTNPNLQDSENTNPNLQDSGYKRKYNCNGSSTVEMITNTSGSPKKHRVNCNVVVTSGSSTTVKINDDNINVVSSTKNNRSDDRETITDTIEEIDDCQILRSAEFHDLMYFYTMQKAIEDATLAKIKTYLKPLLLQGERKKIVLIPAIKMKIRECVNNLECISSVITYLKSLSKDTQDLIAGSEKIYYELKNDIDSRDDQDAIKIKTEYFYENFAVYMLVNDSRVIINDSNFTLNGKNIAFMFQNKNDVLATLYHFQDHCNIRKYQKQIRNKCNNYAVKLINHLGLTDDDDDDDDEALKKAEEEDSKKVEEDYKKAEEEARKKAEDRKKAEEEDRKKGEEGGAGNSDIEYILRDESDDDDNTRGSSSLPLILKSTLQEWECENIAVIKAVALVSDKTNMKSDYTSLELDFELTKCLSYENLSKEDKDKFSENLSKEDKDKYSDEDKSQEEKIFIKEWNDEVEKKPSIRISVQFNYIDLQGLLKKFYDERIEPTCIFMIFGNILYISIICYYILTLLHRIC